MPKHVSQALDELAKRQSESNRTVYGGWHPGGKPNRSAVVQELIREAYERATGKKLRH